MLQFAVQASGPAMLPLATHDSMAAAVGQDVPCNPPVPFLQNGDERALSCLTIPLTRTLTRGTHVGGWGGGGGGWRRPWPSTGGGGQKVTKLMWKTSKPHLVPNISFHFEDPMCQNVQRPPGNISNHPEPSKT